MPSFRSSPLLIKPNLFENPSGAALTNTPLEKLLEVFKTPSKVIATCAPEQVTRVEAFHSLLRVFGPYGADRLVAKTLEITVLAITALEVRNWLLCCLFFQGGSSFRSLAALPLVAVNLTFCFAAILFCFLACEDLLQSLHGVSICPA